VKLCYVCRASVGKTWCRRVLQCKQRLCTGYKKMVDVHREFPADVTVCRKFSVAQRALISSMLGMVGSAGEEITTARCHLSSDTKTISIDLRWFRWRLFELAHFSTGLSSSTGPTIRRWDNQIANIASANFTIKLPVVSGERSDPVMASSRTLDDSGWDRNELWAVSVSSKVNEPVVGMYVIRQFI